jgi:pyrroline-5-carboxylate reductase
MVKIGFIGSGNMAQSLIKAILDKGISDNYGIISSDPDIEKLKAVKKDLDIKVTEDNLEVVKNSNIIILAVKPQEIDKVLNEIKASITNDKIILSIAAGVKISQIETVIGKKKIVRVMPNAPCQVGEMAAGFTPNSNLTEQEISTIEIILGSAGKAFRLKEDLLDAVTGLSGSGPAFVARIIEGFTEAGIDNGLSEEIAYQLTLQTFLGAAKLLMDKKMSPSELIKIVSSPKGTTIAGREILDKSEIKLIIKKTIKTATDRSKELGRR